MKRFTNHVLGLFSVFFFLCLIVAQSAISADVTMVETSVFTRTADNFIVLFDNSGSMEKDHWVGDESKVDAAKQILQEMNSKLPDLGYYAALYTITPLKAYYEYQPYNKYLFGQAVDSLPDSYPLEKYVGGTLGAPTYLGKAIKDLSLTIDRAPGKTVVYIFSDGLNTGELSPVEEAKKLAASHDVCFEIVGFADEGKGKDTLKAIADVNSCSRLLQYTAFLSSPALCVSSLCDYGTILEVDASATDWDQDGVPSALDLCAMTPKGYEVDENGCAKPKIIEPVSIHFAFGSAKITPEMKKRVEGAAEIYKKHPEAMMVVSGHTDSIGPLDYNLTLSTKRAINVKEMLTTHYGISSNQILVRSYGEVYPRASNQTSEGRMENRRAEIILHGAYHRKESR